MTSSEAVEVVLRTLHRNAGLSRAWDDLDPYEQRRLREDAAKALEERVGVEEDEDLEEDEVG